MSPRPHPVAFTLVELLVVVTVLVLLLALLAPALDRAMYQAELATCGARLRAVAGGVVTYAVAHRRCYPVRNGARFGADWYPFKLRDAGYDDRSALGLALDINGLLNDPAAGAVDLLTARSAYVYTSYSLWFGWQYRPPGGAESPMFKLGDRWSWSGREFDLLGGDHDRISVNPAAPASLASHPDEGPLLDRVAVENDNDTFARWQNLTAHRRRMTLNFLHADGSVRRYDHVGVEDDRMTRVPDRSDAGHPDAWWDTAPAR